MQEPASPRATRLPLIRSSAAFRPHGDVGAWLQQRALADPGACAYLYLRDGEDDGLLYTYARLDAEARAVAAWLLERGVVGDRVLLAHAPGPAFLPAFFGCLYAGMIAVPAFPPRRNAHLGRLESILADSGARLAIADSTGGEALRAMAAADPRWESLRRLEADPSTLPLDPGWQPSPRQDDDLAFLQYTSGSTRDPRGVMVSHGNLRHNTEMMESALGFDRDSVSVSWLPVFHDLGLILGVLQPLYTGIPAVLMPPNAFLQKPLRWLQALSRYGGTHSPAPNFAYELCASKITAAEKEGLDLSAWRCALNGAEPVRRGTLRRFARAFRGQGFRASTLFPAYGLAEATLVVSGGPVGQGAKLVKDPSAASRAWTPSGRPIGQDVRIVDPQTRAFVEAGQLGEIWVRGECVALGYWQKPQESAEVFAAHSADGQGPYLRTGDLGFFAGDQLVIGGRLKDLIVLRGTNHYPQDLEAAMQAVSTDLRPGCGAAFSIEQDGQEALVVVQELQRHPAQDPAALAQAIRQALAENEGVSPAAIVLIATASVPKTSSGKIRRRACRQQYLEGSLQVVHAWSAESAGKPVALAMEDDASWALHELQRLSEGPGPKAGLRASLAAWALDSLQVASFKAALEQRLQRSFSLEELYAAKSLAALLAVDAGAEETRSLLRPLAASFLIAAQAGAEPSRVLVELQGPALGDPQRVAGALEALRQRHPSLRARFGLDQGQAWAVNDAETAGLPLPLSAIDEAHWSAETSRLAQHAFDPSQGGLFKALWAKSGDAEGRLAVLFDHLACDGWSVKAWVDGLHVELTGKPAAAPAVALSGSFGGAQGAKDLEAWVERLADWDAFPELPGGFAEAGAPAEFATSLQRLDALTVQRLRTRAGELGVAPLALVSVALARSWNAWLPGERLVFNLAQHARGPQDQAMGCFADLLPLDLRLPAESSLAQDAEEAHRALLFAQAHSAASGIDLVRERAKRQGGRPQALSPITLTSALFFDWQALDGLRTVGVRSSAPETWLDLMLFKEGQAWALAWNHRLDKLSPARAERLQRQFRTVLEALLEGRELGPQALLAAEDLAAHAALEAGYAPLHAEGSLSGRFDRQAAATPAAVALRGADGVLTYGQLQALADDLAARLQSAGVGPGRFVGIRLERGLEVVVAILGVLKSGAAYVPMDPIYPAERLAFLAADAELAALVAEPGLEAGFARGVPRVPARAQAGSALKEPQAVGTGPGDLAYIIYTSGSTGRPKGCMVRHGDVLRLLTATEEHYDFGAQDVWTLFHSYAFDFSVWEIWGALAYGGSVVIVPGETAASPRDFHALLRREGVSVLNQTPSAFRALADQDAALPEAERLSGLRWVIFGGEALDYASLRRWFEQHGDAQPRLVNMYGITETTVHVSYRRVRRQDVEEGVGSLIGTPLKDMRLRLLDAQGRPTPLGVAGELWVGGGGVALGYWRRQELTAQRFVQGPEGRFYRSGDRARLLPGKGLEYLGRGDEQVQVRGFRVELGEIQARLLEDARVAQAVVLASTDAVAGTRLAAYLVPRQAQTLDLEALRLRLAQTLPPYMVPSLLSLPALPLTPHGKLDRAALPDPWTTALKEPQAPSDALEERLLQAWCQVLGRATAGVEDDFFASGGHSLSAAAFHSQALRLSGASVPLKAFLQAPTVRALAAALRQAPAAGAQALMSAPRRQRALPAQAALWAAQQWQPHSSAWHIAWTLQGSAPLDVERVQRALRALARREPALRSAFEQDAQGQLWHFEADAEGLVLPWEEAQPQSAAQAALWLDAWRRLPVDLAKAPLWRCAWAPLTDGGWLLGFCVHHLIFDQASFDGWHQALESVTEGAPEAPYWQHLQAQGRAAIAAPGKSGVELPSLADLAGNTAVAGPAAWERALVPAALVAELRALARAEGCSFFTLLASAWGSALATVLGTEEAAFRVPVSRREGPGSEKMLGYWVEPRALRLRLPVGYGVSERLREAIAAVKALTLGQAPAASSSEDLYLVHQEEAPSLPTFLGQAVRVQTLASADCKALAALLVSGAERLELNLEYDPRRLSGVRARRLCTAMTEALRALVHGQGALPLAPMALSLLQGRRPEPSEHRSWVDRWHGQVEIDANALALQWRGGSLSYGRLQKRVRAVAGYLAAQGLQAGQRVGVCASAGPQWVVGLLACWELGLVYVPMDPAYPADRLAFMLERADCRAVLSDREAPAWCARPWLSLEEAWRHPGTWLRPSHRPRPEEAAYLVFTSGSTGRPKAVQVPHRALDNLARGFAQALGLQAGDRLMQFVSISFDPSMEEVCASLAVGATLALPCRSGAPSADDLTQAVEDFGISVLHLPTAYWHACVAAGAAPVLAGTPGLRALVIGGEAPDPQHLQAWLDAANAGHRVYNAYGPSEACITTTLWACQKGDPIPDPVPLGEPLPGTRLALVDAQGALAPVGQEGEIWIAGEGLADGYWEEGQLSQAGFGPAAWEVERGVTASRWYRSGDRGRLTADGHLIFVGRQDRQVKVAGHRLELGELESLARRCPGVAQVAATFGREPGPGEGLRLWAAPLPGLALDAATLRAFLQERLPAALLPRAIQVLGSLPLTVNGKLDLKAIEAPQPPRHGAMDPSLAQRITALWQRLLGEPGAGLDADFFALGGDSLRAIRAAAEASAWSPRSVKVADIVAAPTPRALAQRLGAVDEQPFGAAEDSEEVWLRLGGEARGPAFFWLPPAGLGARALAGLARGLANEGPQWGLALGAPKGPGAWQDWCEQACEALERCAPTGPLVIGGWSVGALLAADLVQALHERGREVRRLVLIEAVQTDPLIGSMVAAAPAHLALWAPTTAMGADPGLQRAVEAAAAFRPRALPVPVTLALSEASARQDARAAWMAWALLAREGMTSLLLPGDHLSVLGGEAAAVLAQRVRQDLEPGIAGAIPREEKEVLR